MKVFIVKEGREFCIYKVSDELLSQFKEKKDAQIIVEAQDIQQVIQKFCEQEHKPALGFNPVLNRYTQSKLKANMRIKPKAGLR